MDPKLVAALAAGPLSFFCLIGGAPGFTELDITLLAAYMHAEAARRIDLMICASTLVRLTTELTVSSAFMVPSLPPFPSLVVLGV